VEGSLYYGASTEPLDYVFAHFCGIFITSLSYFTLYCIYKAVRREPPQIFPRSVLPAMASGSLWAIAMIAWFVANGNLQVSSQDL
jgi:H+/Cl- antiporter ClcA